MPKSQDFIKDSLSNKIFLFNDSIFIKLVRKSLNGWTKFVGHVLNSFDDQGNHLHLNCLHGCPIATTKPSKQLEYNILRVTKFEKIREDIKDCELNELSSDNNCEIMV